MAAAGLEALRPVLEKTGQQHLLGGYDALPEEQQAALLEQLKVRACRPCSAQDTGSPAEQLVLCAVPWSAQMSCWV